MILLSMDLFYKLSHWYFSKKALPYWCIFTFDCLVVLLSGLVCYALDYGIISVLNTFAPLLGTLCFYLIFYIIGFRIMHTYAGIMRYTSWTDIYHIAIANLIGIISIAMLRMFFYFDSIFVPIRMRELALTFILATIIMWTARIIVKYMFEFYRIDQEARPAFIYGVKNGGTSIARAINTEETRRFRLLGFISDAEDLEGKDLMGVKVYKNDGNIVKKMNELNVSALLISPLKQKALANNPVMVDQLIEAGISIFIMNTTMEWDGKSDVSAIQLKEVEIEDLLPRDEIQIDLKAVGDLLCGKSIMITGSAGSIGSEIARQVAKFSPEKILLIDQAETPQHDMRLFMEKQHPHIKAETVVTSICNKSRMETLFKMYKPDYVFHAAAYKHVPMMEDNPCEAIQNNVEGTKIMADLSVKYGVRKFVMISTDKAVNPTNVMGCSKRICEIYVQSLDKAIKDNKINGMTQFVTTRFGNVLGSNGSVIPLFREQIKNGGPLTVTHPDIFRYFMLIPEACKLVLEAGTMGKGGEIFVFDMGAPVKIADLAKRMIKLSGASNIDITYTGLRDGEKLYEEVLNDQEKTQPTFNKKIKIATVREYDFNEVKKQIDKLITCSYKYDDMETVAEMKTIVPEYKSNHSVYEILDKKNEQQ